MVRVAKTTSIPSYVLPLSKARIASARILSTTVVLVQRARTLTLSARHQAHQGGKEAGSAIFLAILEIIRPVALIAHGAGANKELARLLCTHLPSPPSRQADGVIRSRVDAQLGGVAYAPMIFAIPSLAPPKWNSWQGWAQTHLAEVCSEVRKCLDEDFQEDSLTGFAQKH